MPITRAEKMVIVLIIFLVTSFGYYIAIAQAQYNWELFEGFGFICVHFLKLIAIFALVNYLFKKVKRRSLI
jgi:hypothetical protein